jgi:ADP-heptose:LPS heptosyltransferase
MHEARFDLAVQLHGGGRYSNPFIRRLGARLTIGMRTPDAEPLDRSIPYIYFQPEVFRYLEVVALAGAIPGCAEPNVSVTEADLVEADQAVPDSGKPLAVLNPCATDSRRRWPAERFSEIGDALTRAGADVAVIGLAAGRKLVQGVLSAMAMPGIDLCNRLSLKGLIGVLARSRVLISNDSGPLHLASAVGAATVGIYWCGNLINACPLTRTRHRQAISWRLDCPVCSLNCLQERCPHTDSFVADISASEVLRSAMDLLVGSPYGPYERRSTGTAPQADSPGRSSEGAASTATKFRRNPALRPSRGDVQPVRRIGR